MKQTRDYSKMTPLAKREKGVQDVKDYLGAEMFDTAVRCVVSCITVEHVRFNLSFTGIEGYPSKAMWETYNKTGQQEAKENDSHE